MTNLVAKLQGGRNDQQRFFLNILAAEDGKEGYPAYLNEQGKPGRRVRLFLKQHGDRSWFEISGPLRTFTEDKKAFQTRLRQNEQGQYLNNKGEVVNAQQDAAQEYVYVTRPVEGSDQPQVVYGTIGSLNINNTKSDNTPTKITLANLTLIRDDVATDIAREVARLQMCEKNSDQYKQVEANLNQLRQNMPANSKGNFGLFIDEGADFLRGLGFEVRLKDAPSAPQQPQNGQNAGTGGPGF